MNTKIIWMTLIGMAFSVASFCQKATTAVNPNAEHDRMYWLVVANEKNEAPDFAVAAFKLFAKEKGYDEKNVLRNITLFKPLYNKNVSKEDKLFVIKILLRMCENPITSIPISLVNRSIKELSKN